MVVMSKTARSVRSAPSGSHGVTSTAQIINAPPLPSFEIASQNGDIVLGPFSGTGTTCIAAVMLKRDYDGIAISLEYHEITLKRLDHFRREKRLDSHVLAANKKRHDFH
jgi:hypothetical protein